MINIGIIGAGRNAAGHAKYFHECDRTNVVAVADPATELAKELAGACDAKPVGDYTEFLGDVDAVVISSPNFLHREHAVACAQAGKHILCEKPMGLSADEAQQIADAVAAASVKSLVGFSVRFTDNVWTLIQMIKEGRLGELNSVFSRRLSYSDPAGRAGWRKDHAKSGGILLEINVHELEWMMAAGGDVKSVYARTKALTSDAPRANDHVWFVLNYTEGAVGTHEGSWLAATVNYYRGAHGTEGGAATDEWGRDLFYAKNGSDRAPVDLTTAPDKRLNWLDTIDGAAEPLCDVAWGLKVMRVAEAILQSAGCGEVVRLASGQ
jgi:predicted dehydrogenase